MVTSGLVAGAVITTLRAPAARCLAASSRLVNLPVDSNTMSTPRSFHGSEPGSLVASTLNWSLPTLMVSAVALTGTVRLPSTESYFNRCASVAASVMSLTATMSTSVCARAARMMLRPMRPNPLIPTLMAMNYVLAGDRKT